MNDFFFVVFISTKKKIAKAREQPTSGKAFYSSRTQTTHNTITHGATGRKVFSIFHSCLFSP